MDAAAILAGDRRALAKAITLIESTVSGHQQIAQSLLEQLLPHTGNSWRIGVSGSPGVGKSTFIEAFGSFAAEHGRKVAVLAVDPSSPRTGGSILGDKTRMRKLSERPDVFVRPSPSAKKLGGVTHTTRESILLCEAAGFNTVLVETVGTGQSEYEVSDMVDFFLVLISPNSGDELQGIKRGLVELANAVLINKADGLLKKDAGIARSQYESALRLMQPHSFWTPQVRECSALEGSGIDCFWQMINMFFDEAIKNGHYESQRAQQRSGWLRAMFMRELQALALEKPKVREMLDKIKRQVIDGKTTPYAAVQRIVRQL